MSKKEFYVTFGQKDPTRRDGWVRLTGFNSYDKAHGFARVYFDGEYSMVRSADDFNPAYFPDGELAVIDVSSPMETAA